MQDILILYLPPQVQFPARGQHALQVLVFLVHLICY